MVVNAAQVNRRKFKAEEATEIAPPVAVPSIEPDSLTAAQMREARRKIRDRQAALRKERAFGARVVATLTEGQNALNIGFGAILSAYIGNVLTAIDDKPFHHPTLALFFVLIGLFVGGLCIGNSVVLRRHFGLGAVFLSISAAAAIFSLRTAATLGFELPILKILFASWFSMLLASDVVLTLVVFIHHQQVAA